MKKSKKEVSLMEQLKTFADVCSLMGKQEADYAIPEGTNKEKADMYLKRLKLVAAAFNGKEKPSLANTEQWKYWPWFSIEPDADAPGGFRLSSATTSALTAFRPSASARHF
jgi:hypothetical protein